MKFLARNRGGNVVRDAFTLIELLVSMSVLVLLVVVAAQVLDHVSNLLVGSNKNTGALNAGEAVLAQINLDVSRMVVRGDVDYDFTKQAGNDRLSFYARTTGLDTSGNPSTGSTRPLSVVSYQVGANPNSTGTANSPLQLNYGALQIDWAASPATGLTVFAASKIVAGTQTQYLAGGSLPLPGTSNYSTLAQEVIRFEYCFLLKTDPNNKLLKSTAPVTDSNGTPPIGSVAGLLVAIVVVDPQTRLLFPAGADASLAAKFADSQDNQDLLSLWTPTLTVATLKALNIPADALQGIYIYQKFIPLPGNLH